MLADGIMKTILVKRGLEVLCKPSGWCTVHQPRSDEYSVKTLLRISCSRPYLKLKPHYRFDNEIQSGLQISHAAVPDRGNTDEADYSREALLGV